MTDFTDHKDVLVGLQVVQDAEEDNRDAAREAHLFVDKRDGQWEPFWFAQNKDRPRYTFDKVGPIVDQICGEMQKADFAVKIKPAGGDSTKDGAQLLDGLVRNIQNISNSSDIYDLAGRNMVTAGLDGWQVKQKFVDDDSFDQDLVIEPISNYIDSVWFWPFKKPDASDAKACVVLEAVPVDEYNQRWPEGSKQSISENRLSEAYYHKIDQIIVGQLYFVEEVARDLLLMSTGRVLEDTHELDSVLDELAQGGEKVVKRRTRNKCIVKSHLFDGGGWLGHEQHTVFSMLPVIPVIANFKIFENKLLYRGAVEKMIDAQRVFNYTESRMIEETSMAPRAKYWMTKDQAAGHEDELATLNTNADPMQFYNADPAAPGPPQQNGGAVINPGLQVLSADMNQIINQTAGMFAANMGDNPGLQSGIAIKSLQNKGDRGTIKFFRAMERAICRTCKVIVAAIPAVYDTPRQLRILKEDGSFDLTDVNQPIRDQQTGAMVTTNDLSKGKYDVTCSSGPSFQNRQDETVAAIVEMGQVDASIIEMGGDILFNNISSPGMDLIAERKRLQLFRGGLIPFEQQTEEEQQQTVEQQNQEPQQDPLMVAAQAEANKAQVQLEKVIADTEIARSKESRENFKAQMGQQKQQFDMMMEMQKRVVAELNTQAETLKFLREGLGAGPLVGPAGIQTFVDQTEIIHESQEQN